jgi:phosphoribosylaminoimidazole carboxylase PurE protein
MKKKNILVGIIMGSDSDIPVMKEAEEICSEFGVECEMSILSAHRTPEITARYASAAYRRGIKVIIAGAGGAAHLPGVVAAHFPLPVIGVPIKSKSLDGLDSLLSIVQMPPGVPVATVGINGAKNAGLLAMEILASGNEKLAKKMADYKKKLEEESMEKNLKLKD